MYVTTCYLYEIRTGYLYAAVAYLTLGYCLQGPGSFNLEFDTSLSALIF